MTIAGVRLFIASNTWTFAKTMPQWPHWYVVRQKCSDEAEFLRAVEFIREHGQARKFGKHTFIYLDVDDFTYWTLGAPVGATTIINRARIQKT